MIIFHYAVVIHPLSRTEKRNIILIDGYLTEPWWREAKHSQNRAG